MVEGQPQNCILLHDPSRSDQHKIVFAGQCLLTVHFVRTQPCKPQLLISMSCKRSSMDSWRVQMGGGRWHYQCCLLTSHSSAAAARLRLNLSRKFRDSDTPHTLSKQKPCRRRLWESRKTTYIQSTSGKTQQGSELSCIVKVAAFQQAWLINTCTVSMAQRKSAVIHSRQ